MKSKITIETIKRRTRGELIQELLEANGNQCPVCGKTLETEDCVIDHICPVSMGGTDELGNLQILCRQCNSFKGNKPFLGYQFEGYIKKLLESNDKYANISNYRKINGKTIDADIIFEKTNNSKNELFVAEVMISSSFTEGSVRKITKQLLEYKEVASNIIPLFITPNEIPSKYAEIMNQNGIQIWDKTFIGNEFYMQIQKTEPASFRLFFDLPYETAGESDKYRKLIKELKECSPGWANLVEYQNLIGRILEALFCPPLNSPIPQSNDKSKKNRRDFILPNYSKMNDTWKFLRDRYYADFIVVDAKNSKKNISKEDVLQIANYLKKDGTGLFGIIIARKGTNSASENALRDMWIHQQKMIVVLNDVDMEQMLLDKKAGDEDPAKLILQKIEDFRLLI